MNGMKVRGSSTAKSREKSYARNLATMKLLVSHAPFQDEVRKLRKASGIEMNAEGRRGREEDMAWQEVLDSRDEKAFASASFQDEVRNIKRREEAGEITPRQAHRQRGLLERRLPAQEFEKELDGIVDTFELPHHFKDAVRAYVRIGAITAPRSNYEAVPAPVWEMKRKRSPVKIAVYAQLADDELDRLKRFIDHASKGKFQKYRALELDEVERNLAIERACSDRMRGGEEKSSLADIAEEFLGDRERAGQISAIVRDLRKTRQGRFEPNMRKAR